MARSRKKIKKRNVSILFLILIVIFVCIFIFIKKDDLNTSKISVDFPNTVNADNKYNVKVSYNDDVKNLKCSLDNKEYVDINECTFDLDPGKYTIYLKNDSLFIKKTFTVESKYEGTFSSTIDKLETYYLASNGKKAFKFTFDYPKGFDTKVTYKVEDPSVLKVENDTMIALKAGETKVTATLKDGNSKTYNVLVTDLIVSPVINTNKSFLPCGRYTKEENELLDKILASRVEEAGVGTRAGVAAAARFITLEFPYTIKYFNENGRMGTTVANGVDAEGRYYHKGLYLNEYKFSELTGKSTATGPQIWGCDLHDSFLSGLKGGYLMRPNGFTCSGFVTWAMLNGGFDVGDVGAGDRTDVANELSDMGPHIQLTYDFMKNGDYQVGDFIARDGHAAIIIGFDDKNIYTAESLPPKLKVYVYERWTGIVNDPNLTYTIDMTGIYPNGEGTIEDMW